MGSASRECRLWPGAIPRARRLRQELSFTAALAAASPFLGRPLMPRPDLMLVASPSFPALAARDRQLRTEETAARPLAARHPSGRRRHDGLLEEGSVAVRASRRLERAAYRAADRIVVLSKPFEDNLLAKDVPPEKIDLIYDPATMGIPATPSGKEAWAGPPRLISMGNIGLSPGARRARSGVRGLGGDGAPRRSPDDHRDRRGRRRGEGGDSLPEDADARPAR